MGVDPFSDFDYKTAVHAGPGTATRTSVPGLGFTL